VLHGEPGIGKTALLETIAAEAAAAGLTTARIAGLESELPLGYAALHRLLVSFPEHLERLPGPQREALRRTFGLVGGGPPDRFLVALGVLSLLAEVASCAPLLCVVDDAQWLDPESAMVLGFVARRLHAEQVVMLFAARVGENAAPLFEGVPELEIAPLSASHAATLVSRLTGGEADPLVVARVVAESGGNPLALQEIVRELTPDQLAGVAALPDPLPATGSLQQLYNDRLRRLAPAAQLLLGAAAAEPDASGTLLERVAARLGADLVDPVSDLGGLADLSGTVEFRHPLVRSAAYHGLTASQRRLVHRALAEATDRDDQPGRFAWHLAMAAVGPDDDVAAQLEEAADRGGERGGYYAAATLLAKAAELSTDGHRRTDRLLAASEAALAAGRAGRAQELLEQARGAGTDIRHKSLSLRLAAEVALANGEVGTAARELLSATRLLTTTDGRLASMTLLAALTAANSAGRDELDEVRAFAAHLPQLPAGPGGEADVANLFLSGMLARLAGEPAQAAPLLRQALRQLFGPATPDSVRLATPPIVAYVAATELLDEELTFSSMRAYADFLRQAGAFALLPAALSSLARSQVQRGRFDDAEAACTEARLLSGATGAPGSPDVTALTSLLISCWRGQEVEARARAEKIGSSSPSGPASGMVLSAGDLDHELRHALAVLDLGLGRYRQALGALRPIVEEDPLGGATLVLADFVEAAVRGDDLDGARVALARLAARAEAAGAAWGRGLLARCQALSAPDGAAEDFFRQAIDLLAATAARTDLARSHLLFGEWLRRQRRRREARFHLTTARDLFARIGAEAFARRAQVELEATGPRTQPRGSGLHEPLTPQEAQVARLVTEGGTNRDIAARLYISPATVDYHLRKVYLKRGVRSRTQLVRAMVGT
jgi:DNA-binding CsgD family transcriptional regulator